MATFSLDSYLAVVLAVLCTVVWKVRFSPPLMDLLSRKGMCRVLILEYLVVILAAETSLI